MKKYKNPFTNPPNLGFRTNLYIILVNYKRSFEKKMVDII
jgi:hypothetical protein